MKTAIELISDITEAEMWSLLFDICERVPIADEDLSYSALPDKITRYINEAHRLFKLEEAVTNYIVEECCNENIGVQDPINFLLASHHMLRANLHYDWKEG
jgi:hypothetical protein